MSFTLIKLAVASIALMATPVMAQSQSAPAPARATNEPTVAATLPNAFGASQPAAPATPARPAANTPSSAANSAPNSVQAETALRSVITALQSGTVDYGVFTDDLAAQVREQADTIGSLLTQFGPLQSMTHKGQPDEADLFEVGFEKQKTEWLIGFDNNKKIAALLFRPAED